MAIFRNRLPSKRDTVLVLASCAVPIYSWSMLVFFRKVSRRWLYFLNTWDLTGILAYAQIFAFLESMVFLLVLVLLSVLLPRRLFRDRFVAQSAVAVFLASVFAVLLQYRPGAVSSPAVLLLGLALYLVLNGTAYVVLRRFGRLEESIRALTERLVVLFYLYAGVTLLCAAIVVFRNTR